jgi:hypothetical protein
MKQQKFYRDFPLIVSCTWREYQKVQQLVYNKFGRNIEAIAVGNRDTEFIYELWIRHELKNSEFCDIRYYVEGVIACMKSY